MKEENTFKQHSPFETSQCFFIDVTILKFKIVLINYEQLKTAIIVLKHPENCNVTL